MWLFSGGAYTVVGFYELKSWKVFPPDDHFWKFSSHVSYKWHMISTVQNSRLWDITPSPCSVTKNSNVVTPILRQTCKGKAKHHALSHRAAMEICPSQYTALHSGHHRTSNRFGSVLFWLVCICVQARMCTLMCAHWEGEGSLLTIFWLSFISFLRYTKLWWQPWESIKVTNEYSRA